MSPDQVSEVKGRLVVATPLLADPNFDHTVVLVLEHSEDGALGVVLNRPSLTDVSEALPEWAEMVVPPSQVFVGGPVDRSAIVAVAHSATDDDVEGVAPVAGRLGVVDLHRGRDHYLGDLDRLRLFAGYAGWGSGQLEAELEEGSWYLLDAQADDAFTEEPVELWRAVLQRAGGKLAQLASAPFN